MDAVLDFLIKIENEYKSDLLAVNQEINVINEQVKNIKQEITDIDANIDKAYEMFSSSQTANIVENTEVQTKQEILKVYETDLIKYIEKKEKFQNKIEEVQKVISEYTLPVQNTDISDKIDFVIKLIPVDTERAILELKDIKETMFHVKH